MGATALITIAAASTHHVIASTMTYNNRQLACLTYLTGHLMNEPSTFSGTNLSCNVFLAKDMFTL